MQKLPLSIMYICLYINIFLYKYIYNRILYSNTIGIQFKTIFVLEMPMPNGTPNVCVILFQHKIPALSIRNVARRISFAASFANPSYCWLGICCGILLQMALSACIWKFQNFAVKKYLFSKAPQSISTYIEQLQTTQIKLWHS